MSYFLQQIANAVPLATLYASLAFGYAIAFAVTRRADITYGAIFAFSGHLYVLVAHFGWNELRLVLPAALALGALAALSGGVATGMVSGRFIIRPRASVSPNAVIVGSLGLVLVLMEGARLAAQTRELWLPPLMKEPIVLWSGEGFPVTLTTLQCLSTAILLLLLGMGAVFLVRSTWGRRWRAVSEDSRAAEMCGVDARTVFVMSYAAAALMASICGILATSYYGTMDFGAGLVFGLKVVLIAAAGGHAHPIRAAGGAAVIGFAETLWAGYGPIVWRDLVIVGGLVAVLVMSRRERIVP
ncbi:branched-chain amino acid ABC transporter permease [Pseudorhizobium halotolerans]|uniref:Branched-chain amino acid ABC transporter permease n=1 Tax=Pseudorhizobium halotolerans TaxID=1233081 RepID=A0ABN7JI91_9HYPH|nr:branched-chain amino acid ABC transporter permease [Pseudorhizobium halotolerans]CAD7027749.1 branched-chain amino acid ABC transporter permease [Pseudorhizobium halotolerans]